MFWKQNCLLFPLLLFKYIYKYPYHYDTQTYFFMHCY